jgi:hypothetical protein
MNFPMIRNGYALVALTLALFQVGCAKTDGTKEDPSDVKSSMGVTPEAIAPPTPGNPGVYGTWSGAVAGVGHFDNLVLMTDGRYHNSHQVVCAKAPCPPIGEDGTLELYSRGGVRYVSFVAQGTTQAERYEFVYKTGLLRLRHILPGAEWYSMQRAGASWCSEARDCTMQALPPGVCAGGYTCSNNQCAWQCGGRGEPATN